MSTTAPDLGGLRPSTGDKPGVIHRVSVGGRSYMCGRVRPVDRWGKRSVGVNPGDSECQTCEVAYVRYLVTGQE